jgi:hypothetical protein
MKKLILIALAFCLVAFTPQTTNTVGASWTTVCDATTNGVNNLSFKVKNTGANPFTDCVVEVYVGPTDSDWYVFSNTWTQCKSLAAAGTTHWAISGMSEVKIRVRAKSAAGTSAYCRIDGQ